MIVSMNRKKILLRILLIAQILIIYSFSMMNGESSGQASGSISLFVYNLLHLPFGYDGFHLFIRKCAHFTEFAVLGGIAFLNAEYYPFFERKKETILFFMLAVPLSDEYLQTFVPERAGALTDSLIDMAGYLTGACILHLLMRYISRKKEDSQEFLP